MSRQPRKAESVAANELTTLSRRHHAPTTPRLIVIALIFCYVSINHRSDYLQILEPRTKQCTTRCARTIYESSRIVPSHVLRFNEATAIRQSTDKRFFSMFNRVQSLYIHIIRQYIVIHECKDALST